MCYSPSISLGFAGLGAISTWMSLSNPRLRKLYVWVFAAFYTLMELTQTVQYMYVNKCGESANYYLTEWAYLLVLVQPLMFHTVGYIRCKRPEDKQVFGVALAMFGVWMFFNILSRVLYDPKLDVSKTHQWSYLFGKEVCTLRDTPTSHIYWQWSGFDLKDFNANYLNYLMIWFIPPMFVKTERIALLTVVASFLVGTWLTYMYGRIEEHPATWCYVSSPVIAFGIIQNVIMKMKHKAKMS